MHGKAKHHHMPKDEGVFVLNNTKGEHECGNFKVLATDYKSYAIVYKCKNSVFNRVRNQMVWIYTRKPLDPGNSSADEIEFNRIYVLASDFLEQNLPDYDFNE